MTAGVYAIVNTTTGKAYVGSSVDVERRWNGRRWELRRGTSANQALQSDWSAAQGQGFEFRILEVTSRENEVLLKAEERWIAQFQVESHGVYNVRQASIGRHGFSMQRRGWGWVRTRTKAHYFLTRGQFSLCQKVARAGAYGLEDTMHDSPDNCVICRKLHAALPKRRRASSTAAERE